MTFRAALGFFHGRGKSRVGRRRSRTGPWLALVIGISDYATPGWSLDRAVPDAEAVADALRKHAKFSVTPILNPTVRLLRLQVEEFAAKVREGDVVVVYYGGHGLEHRGETICSRATSQRIFRGWRRRRSPPTNSWHKSPRRNLS